MSPIPQMSPEALKSRLVGGSTPVILDVREPWEHAIARLPGSVLIPLGELPERSGELAPEAETVVVCHHGVRSQRAAWLLRGLGFSAVVNLAGGLDAYSSLDPSIPRY